MVDMVNTVDLADIVDLADMADVADVTDTSDQTPVPHRVGDPRERRLPTERALLAALIAANPARLHDPHWQDASVSLTLTETPALPVSSHPGQLDEKIAREHRLRIRYPLFFPSLPMELYLEHAVVHPNIHPETGFVCLWAAHRATHTIEHALHKLVAMLGWRLANGAPEHVMQPEAWLRMQDPAEAPRVRLLLQAGELAGVAHAHSFHAPPAALRRRLS